MFAIKLKELREESELSQKEFSGIIGVAQSTYALYETARREPSMETLCKIAQYFKVSTDYLLENDMPGLTDYENAISKYGAARGALNSAITRVLEAGTIIEKQDVIIKVILGLDGIFGNLETALTTTFKEARERVNKENIPLIQEISLDDIDDDSIFESWKPSNIEYMLAFMLSHIDKASESSDILNKILDSLIRDYKYRTALKQLQVRGEKIELAKQKEGEMHGDNEAADT